MAKIRKERHQQKPREHTDIALERILTLFNEAKKSLSEDTSLSKRYISLARKIAMKYKVKLPLSLKLKFCKSCNTYLKPSTNCRVRLNQGKTVYHCLSCGNIQRYSFPKSHLKAAKSAQKAKAAKTKI